MPGEREDRAAAVRARWMAELAAAIPNAHLRLIDRAGHNPHSEQTGEVLQAVEAFLAADPRAVAARRPAEQPERSAAPV